MFNILLYQKKRNTIISLIKRSVQMISTAVTTTDSNEETDSSLSDDLKSIQNSIISINRQSSIVLKRYVRNSIINSFNKHQQTRIKVIRYM
jgi:hypothetical protein